MELLFSKDRRLESLSRCFLVELPLDLGSLGSMVLNELKLV